MGGGKEERKRKGREGVKKGREEGRKERRNEGEEKGRNSERKAMQPCKERELEAMFGSDYLKYPYNGENMFLKERVLNH